MGLLHGYEHGFDDPPPRSAIREYQSQHRDKRRKPRNQPNQHDVLAPLPVFRDHPDMFPRASGSSNIPPSGLPASYSHDTQFVRSDSLLGRIFPPSTDHITTPPHHDSRFPINSLPDGEFGSYNPPVPVRNISPPSRHRSHRRESASHRPSMSSPPLSISTTPSAFPVLNTPRRNSSHRGLIVNALAASPVQEEIPQPGRYPLFHPTTIPPATQPQRSHKSRPTRN